MVWKRRRVRITLLFLATAWSAAAWGDNDAERLFRMTQDERENFIGCLHKDAIRSGKAEELAQFMEKLQVQMNDAAGTDARSSILRSFPEMLSHPSKLPTNWQESVALKLSAWAKSNLERKSPSPVLTARLRKPGSKGQLEFTLSYELGPWKAVADPKDPSKSLFVPTFTIVQPGMSFPNAMTMQEFESAIAMKFGVKFDKQSAVAAGLYKVSGNTERTWQETIGEHKEVLSQLNSDNSLDMKDLWRQLRSRSADWNRINGSGVEVGDIGIR